MEEIIEVNLQAKLVENISELIDWIQQVGSVTQEMVVEQTPLFIQELLIRYVLNAAWGSCFWFIVAATIFIASHYLKQSGVEGNWSTKQDDIIARNFGRAGKFLGSFIFSLAAIFLTWKILIVVYTPRVIVFDYVRRLL